MKYCLEHHNLTLKTDYIADVLRILEIRVCDCCKTTYEQACITLEEYSSSMSTDEYVKNSDDLEENKNSFFPSNYDFLWDDEKVEALLATQCGAEYYLHVTSDDSDNEF